MKQRLKQGIREWLEFPDSQASWVKPAVRRAKQLIRSGRFSAVMTVSPPQSAHLIGLALKRWSRLPWIAQFHDPWVGNPFHIPSLRYLERQTAKLEGDVVRAADSVVGATEENTSRMVHRYSDQSSDKFDTLCNGFDPLDFPPLESEGFKVEQPLTMTYTGCLYGDRNPFPLLEGLAQLVERNEVRTGDVRIRLIGDCQHAVGRSIAEAVQKLRLENFVSIERPMSYPDALSALAQSHVLLLFAQNQPAQVPAKLYEYLHVNRFILGFTSGASAGIIERTGAGEVIYGDSVEDITKCLRRILALHHGQGLLYQRVSDESLRPYTATYLAEFLAAKLDRLVGEHRAPTLLEQPAEQSAV